MQITKKQRNIQTNNGEATENRIVKYLNVEAHREN